MSVPVSSLDPNMTDYKIEVVGEMAGFAGLEKGRSAFAAKADTLNHLVCSLPHHDLTGYDRSQSTFP